jgi:nicotinamidase/pyrazinamidase
MSNKALLIIDMLRDFLLPGAPLEVPAARAIIPNIKKRVEEAHKLNIPVIYLCDRHKPDDVEFDVWPPHAVENTNGAQIVDELKPKKQDYIVPKISYSAFYKTELEKLLKKLNIDELIITGVVTNICVLYTAMDALSRGYKVEVPEDSVAALDQEDHKFAMRQIKEVLKPRRKKS